MKTIVEFDFEKATQAINFLAQKEGGAISKLKVVKLIWLVDRHHLRKYGRPVTNDTYYAMKFGPVGSSVKDLVECSDFLGAEERSYVDLFLSCDKDANLISSKEKVDGDILSESDVESLNAVYAAFGKNSPGALVELSHEYPEWKKFETQLKSNGISRMVMSYNDFFLNPEKSADFFKEEPDRLSASRQIFADNFQIANFWI